MSNEIELINQLKEIINTKVDSLEKKVLHTQNLVHALQLDFVTFKAKAAVWGTVGTVMLSGLFSVILLVTNIYFKT